MSNTPNDDAPQSVTDDISQDDGASAQGYQVLARKYRPATFADLKGQDAMVRTLKNAFDAGRIAQAFIMTGIRGTGKTTTARIIAKGMNCIGPDGNGGPTTQPCGQCEHCKAIAQGRHVDVMEMDAASRTGVGDIREIIESVQYRAASARYKIYIIDEVHMLSNSAFNALLKTLEEPPEHVKFIFATTEIRKVPVTVLSRCQRFDLRRIEPEVMMAHLGDIAARENAKIAPDALALITRAAEGSARDALSLMDQAISHGGGAHEDGEGCETSAAQVRAMLGLADRGRVLDLFDLIMKGDAAGALQEFSAQYADGADPMAVLRDLAEITHWVSVIKITPDTADDPTVSPDERSRGREMAELLPMRAMTRMWQLLLKAIDEVAQSPNAMMAGEMAIIRLTHMADLPSPEDLVRKLRQNKPNQTTPPAPRAPHAGAGRDGMTGSSGGGAPSDQGITAAGSGTTHDTVQTSARLTSARLEYGARFPSAVSASTLASSPMSGAIAQNSIVQDGNAARQITPDVALAQFASFEHVLELIRSKRDVKLLIEVETCVQLAGYAPGRIEFVPTPSAPPDLAARLGARLQQWTGQRWGVSVVNSGGSATIAATRDAQAEALRAEAHDHPLMKATLAAFPDAKIIEIRTLKELQQDAAMEALPEVDDDWDPFEQ